MAKARDLQKVDTAITNPHYSINPLVVITNDKLLTLHSSAERSVISSVTDAARFDSV